VDDSDTHFLAELVDRVRASATRPVVLIAEDERNVVTLVDDPPRGYGLDGVWADDFHHHVRRALAGDAEGYYADFTGAVVDIATTLRQGWFYTGQPTVRSGEPRGTDPSVVDPRRMIICIQNHDQIGNRAFGDRLHHTIDVAAYRAASALLLLAPETSLLFMGQEWAATSPFQFFTDHEPALGAKITDGTAARIRRLLRVRRPGRAQPYSRSAGTGNLRGEPAGVGGDVGGAARRHPPSLPRAAGAAS
jgi:maltooligosyltrehalose trehalohydrolase